MEVNKSYLPIAAALFVGLLAGAAMNSGGDDAKRQVARAVAAAEEKVAAATSAVEARIAALEAQAGELVAREAAVETLAGSVDKRVEELGGAVAAQAALQDRVSVISEQVAILVNRLEAVEGKGPALDPDNAEAAPQPQAEAAPAAADPGAAAAADAAAASVGEDGLALRVGQTGAIRGQRVFLSFIDVEAGTARILAVGQAPSALKVGGDSVEIGSGCSVALTGIVDGRAYLQGDCGG